MQEQIFVISVLSSTLSLIIITALLKLGAFLKLHDTTLAWSLVYLLSGVFTGAAATSFLFGAFFS